ncbi:MAG: Tfx family DNA-binding protein [Methanothrix sp.]|jgi:Tfx family DNA-binding protein|uniref:Tfx family DNA-binding protein n=1 Tax=Methanothrix sp. TaxID=90426 RepID=UPI00316ACA10
MIFDQGDKKRAKEARRARGRARVAEEAGDAGRAGDAGGAEGAFGLEEMGSDEPPLSFLTARQREVLQLRHQGLSQQDVADRLGTTRSNISILEKRAHQNILRAERTVQQWMMIRAPIHLFVKGGTDVFDLPRMIFAAADEKGIRLPVTSMDILVQLRRNAPRLFHKRALERDARIYVNKSGAVLVEEAQ